MEQQLDCAIGCTLSLCFGARGHQGGSGAFQEIALRETTRSPVAFSGSVLTPEDVAVLALPFHGSLPA